MVVGRFLPVKFEVVDAPGDTRRVSVAPR